jgi:hypothetical protein
LQPSGESAPDLAWFSARQKGYQTSVVKKTPIALDFALVQGSMSKRYQMVGFKGSTQEKLSRAGDGEAKAISTAARLWFLRWVCDSHLTKGEDVKSARAT